MTLLPVLRCELPVSPAAARRADAPRGTIVSAAMTRAKAVFILAALTLVAGVCFAQSDAVPAFKEVDSMEARVQGCVTCHGQSGQGTNNEYFPRIAGKPAGYL